MYVNFTKQEAYALVWIEYEYITHEVTTTMRMVYTCSICKHSSEFEQNIRECEAKGRKNRFQLKQPVTFFNNEKETSGIIVDIYFVPKSHRVLYSIKKASGECVTVADENIVHAEALPAPAT